ncbi:CCA tRNA nucleotidyltransferase [bacterium CPR1]|nr:CCA tRNA nucleotidyltransferase [bacterium CPR1]
MGGTVRDQLWGLAPKDLDLVVPRPVLEKARSLADRIGASYVLLDESYEIARLIMPDGLQLDLAACLGATLDDDLRRRDFTLNALARRLSDGRLVDPTGGLQDLEQRILRPTSPAVFPEDPLRLLRAVRFLACHPLQPSQDLDGLLQEHHALLARVSPERIQDELAFILRAGMSSQLPRLRTTGLYAVLFPEQPDTRLLERLESDDLAWLGELAAAAKDWLDQPLSATRERRLSLALAALGGSHWLSSRAEQRYQQRVLELAPLALQLSENRAERYRWFRRAGAEAVDACVLAHQLDARAHLAELVRSALTQDQVACPRLPVDGQDLMQALQLKPGPQVGRLLEELGALAAEAGGLTREQALEEARRLSG